MYGKYPKKPVAIEKIQVEPEEEEELEEVVFEEENYQNMLETAAGDFFDKDALLREFLGVSDNTSDDDIFYIPNGKQKVSDEEGQLVPTTTGDVFEKDAMLQEFLGIEDKADDDILHNRDERLKKINKQIDVMVNTITNALGNRPRTISDIPDFNFHSIWTISNI